MRRLTPFLIPAALLLLVLVFYRQAVFSNLIFARGDTFLYFYPYWDYRADSLLAGQLPLWNPYLFMGVPFLANSQAGVFYPLNWPLAVFSAPLAVKISIVVHVVIAAWSTYALARRAFNLDTMPSLLSAAVFACSGYLSAQVEHVNQLQGLAWLPLALLATYQLDSTDKPGSSSLLYVTSLSGIIALQLTAGHTQTTFITLVGCIIVEVYALLTTNEPWNNIGVKRATTLTGPLWGEVAPTLEVLSLYGPRFIWGFGILGFGVFLAFALSSIQLLPTFELSQLSLRGGGLPLNEAVSFSLNPLLLGRALLPGYSRSIFSEFVAYIGMVPLVLALLALTQLRHNRAVQLAALLATIGLFFAVGGYNPVYLLLAKFVPGFNLFRVPARWLSLFALGMAVLAGVGLQLISTQRSTITRRTLLVVGLVPLLLIGLTFISGSITPPGELGPIGLPSVTDLALWLGPLAIIGIAFFIPQLASRLTTVALALSLIELILAALLLPLNNLTTPDAYTSIRPAMTQLLAAQPPLNNNQSPLTTYQLPTVPSSTEDSTQSPQSPVSSSPLARFLSLSQLVFDPGDLGELHSEWDWQLPPDAVYDAIVATKYKEVLVPNLPLTWHVPAVDGYDGGILPLRAYAEFASQFGDVPANTDGRLGQFIKTIPPNDLLNLTNTRWVITDKVGDAWLDNVFYDLGLTATATAPTPYTFSRIPDFQATALGLVLGEPAGSGVAQIAFTNGQSVSLPITYDTAQPVVRLSWETPATIKQIDILTNNRLTLRGASLIDERTGSFHSLTLGPYRLAHSGDVKIYENLNVLPRAFLVSSLESPVSNYQPATITSYTPEQVVIETGASTSGYLVLTDSNYPGWVARLDGEQVNIETAYGLFRAIEISAGPHTVTFKFEPASLHWGTVITAIALLVWGMLLMLGLRERKNVQT